MYTDDEARLLKKFGARVRALRTAQGYSQESFADATQLHRTYMGGVERGERNLSLLNIIKISRILRVHPGELFVYPEPGEEKPFSPAR